jgi:hypothetical protein
LGNDQKNLGNNTKKNHCINGENKTSVDPMIKFFYQDIEKEIQATTKKFRSPNLTIESF